MSCAIDRISMAHGAPLAASERNKNASHAGRADTAAGHVGLN